MNKKIFLLCLVCFFGIPQIISAQPSQKLVTVLVSPDNPGWQYEVNKQATFTVQVFRNEVLMKDVLIDYEIGPEFYPTEKKENVMLKDGKTTLKATMKEPGFLRCKVIAKVDGRQYEGMATAGYNQDQIQPLTIDPEDFDEFWSNAVSEARKVALDPNMTLMPERCTSTQNVYHISFQNDRPGSRIYGILIVPTKPGKYPAILQVPGAGIRPYNGSNYGDEVISLEIGIHGIPVNLPQEVYHSLAAGSLRDYPRVNTKNRDTHYYKRVFLGCIKAVDFIHQLPAFDGNTIGVTGGSQGGALSIITAGLEPRINFLAAFYPAMCDAAGYANRRAGGWPHYFYNQKPGANELETLAYFDVVNFARRVKATGWYSWGFNDTVCPPTSMYAAYNVITGPKELHLYQETGH